MPDTPDTCARLGRLLEQTFVDPLLHITMIQLWRYQQAVAENPLQLLLNAIQDQLRLTGRYSAIASAYTPPSNPLFQIFDTGSAHRSTIKRVLGETHSRWLAAFNKSTEDAALLSQMATIVTYFTDRISKEDIKHRRGWHHLFRHDHTEVVPALESILQSLAVGSMPHMVAQVLFEKVSNMHRVYMAFCTFEASLEQSCIDAAVALQTNRDITDTQRPTSFHQALGLLITLKPHYLVTSIKNNVAQLSIDAARKPEKYLKPHCLVNKQTLAGFITDTAKEFLTELKHSDQLNHFLLGDTPPTYEQLLNKWIGKQCGTPEKCQAFTQREKQYPTLIALDLAWFDNMRKEWRKQAQKIRRTPPEGRAPVPLPTESSTSTPLVRATRHMTGDGGNPGPSITPYPPFLPYDKPIKKGMREKNLLERGEIPGGASPASGPS